MAELLFGKYSLDDVLITDRGIAQYINLDPKKLHTHGRHANRRFKKANLCLIERFINNMMKTEKYTGKKSKAAKVVEKAFDIVYKKTKKNPLQVFIKSIENSAPREETTRLFLSGIYVPQAVDSAPLRRLDVALRNICLGAVNKTFRNKKRVEECLADEIIAASNDDASSFAISKKLEIERIAESAR